MPCKRKKKYVRIRSKDVGRKGHHYIKVGVRKKKGKRGGHTEKIGKLRVYVKVKPHTRNGRKVKAHRRLMR